MVVRRRLASPKGTFSVSSIAAVLARAESRRSERRKTAAKFSRAFLKAKRSARRLPFWCATKTRAQRIIPILQKRFDHRTPISLTKRSTEFEIGRAVGALLRAKQSDA